jgi:hypothetical protein
MKIDGDITLADNTEICIEQVFYNTGTLTTGTIGGMCVIRGCQIFSGVTINVLTEDTFNMINCTAETVLALPPNPPAGPTVNFNMTVLNATGSLKAITNCVINACNVNSLAAWNSAAIPIIGTVFGSFTYDGDQMVSDVTCFLRDSVILSLIQRNGLILYSGCFVTDSVFEDSTTTPGLVYAALFSGCSLIGGSHTATSATVPTPPLVPTVELRSCQLANFTASGTVSVIIQACYSLPGSGTLTFSDSTNVTIVGGELGLDLVVNQTGATAMFRADFAAFRTNSTIVVNKLFASGPAQFNGCSFFNDIYVGTTTPTVLAMLGCASTAPIFVAYDPMVPPTSAGDASILFAINSDLDEITVGNTGTGATAASGVVRCNGCTTKKLDINNGSPFENVCWKMLLWWELRETYPQWSA